MAHSKIVTPTWCVEANQCVGPFACPLGKAVVQRYPFRCPANYSTDKGKRYTDALGRSLYAFVLALKDRNLTSCLRNLRPDVSSVRKYRVKCDNAGNFCVGMLGVSEEAKALYIVYKDTTTKRQLATEIVNGLGAQFGAWKKFESTEAGVITYFHDAFYKLFVDGGMKDDFMQLYNKYPGYRIWLSGFSLGGSFASMTAVYLAKKQLVDKSLLRLVTFGEPRTGNVGYAKEVEENISFRYRVVKRNDFVSSIPRSVDPTTSLGTGTMFDRQPSFYRFLVHYDNNMSKGSDFKICGYSDDFGCRNTMMAFDVIDHMTYFNIDHSQFSAQKCPRKMLF